MSNLFLRFDKDKDGYINYEDFSEEISPCRVRTNKKNYL
jgi:Ca2+-binding EF-hand superfamily protein